MQYREFGRTGKKLSILGFGAMRLPKEEDEAIHIIRHALDKGVNYVDTALVYGESEIIVGKAIADRRSEVYLSTKNPLQDDTGEGWQQRFEKSLTQLNTDYIDFYQVCHGLRWESYVENFSKPGAGLDMARKAKDQGMIHHICFSCHDTPENMIKLIDTGEFEGMTLQYNLLDRNNEDVISYLKSKGMGAIVMGPVGGGRLAESETVRNMIPGGVKSSAEVALRFVLANPNVTSAISGMGSMQMVEENIATASRTEPLSAAEMLQIEEALQETKRLSELYCTGCKYCMPCPNDVNIPQNFHFMNLHKVYGLTDHARAMYATLSNPERPKRGKKAEECIECGECEPKCPQNIRIIDQLKETSEALG